MKKRMTLIVGMVLVAAAAAIAPARATEYTWSENDRLTVLYPALQTLTLQPGDHMWIVTGSNPGEKMFANSVQWANYGAIVWNDGNSPFLTDNGSNLDNYGLLDLQTSGTFWRYPGLGGGWNTLTNAAGGTLRKSGSVGEVLFAYSGNFHDETRFINAGTIDCQVGRMHFDLPMMYFQAGTHFTGAGTSRVATPWITEFTGALTVDPGANLELDNRLNSGSLWAQFRGMPATLHGEAHLLCGDLWGTWTIASDGIVSIAPGLPARIDATLQNSGQIRLEADLYSAGTITNDGVIDFLADGIRLGRQDAAWPTIVNNGIIRKSVGAGRSVLGLDGQPDLNLTNSATGLIDVPAGTLSVFASNFNHNAGQLHVAAGAQLDLATYWPNPFVNQGTVSGAGTVNVTGLFAFVNQGLVQPGDGTGPLTINNGFVQESGGELTIEIGGPAGGQYDELAVTGGPALLGGRLRVRTVNGFGPANLSTFVILTAPDRQQEFSEVIAELPTGYTVDVVYGPTTVTLTFHTPTSGVGPSGPNPGTVPQLSIRSDSSGDPIIAVDLPEAASVRVDVFDLAGSRRSRVSQGDLAGGRHEWRWSGRSDDGRPLQSGVYFVRAEIAGAGGPTVLRAKGVLVR